MRVGVLHSLTGSVAIAEKPIVDATLLALEEINDAGGVLGRRVEPVVVDGCSDWPTFAREADRLITHERVSAIFGCYTSASRRTIIPVVEEHDSVLFYPTYYEGLERSAHVVYTGGTPNQFVIPAVSWMFDNRGQSFYLIGSDYVWPRSTNAVINDLLEALGGQVIGEVYLPLGQSQMADVVQRIVAAKPQVILSTVVGDTNIPFFAELRAAGVTPDTIPTLSMAISEPDLQELDAEQMAGDYIARNYFQSIPTEDNQAFVARFQARYGADRAISDQMEAGYVSPHLWAKAVRRARCVDPPAVRAAIQGQRHDAPECTVYVDEENLHAWKMARIGRIRTDGQVDIIWTSETLIHPVPYSPYRTRRDWEELLHEMYTGWGGSWACPTEPDSPQAASWCEPRRSTAPEPAHGHDRPVRSGGVRRAKVRRSQHKWRLGS